MFPPYAERFELDDLPGEAWRAVPGFEGRYEISSLGRLKSLPNSRRRTPLIRRQNRHPSGYYLVNLTTTVDGRWKQKAFWVARIVARAFHGEPTAGMEACHGNGLSWDNRADNLRWDTPTANQADRARHGTANVGSNNPLAKLTEASAREIKRSLADGVSISELAHRFGVAVSTIKNVKGGYSWRHVDA